MKKLTRDSFCGILVLALSILGIILFALGFSTGYYTFGQMNSSAVLVAAAAAIAVECIALFCLGKYEKALWPKFLTFVVTALLAFAALTLVGDRVEGIGNCIITDYDSGHGGEEAIYLSLGAVLAWLSAMVFNIIGSFGKDEPVKTSGKGLLGCAGALVLLAVLIPSLILGGLFAPKATQAGTGTTAGNTAAATSTYSVKLSGAEGNVDKVQDYQFQCGNLRGLMNYDTRLTLDLALTLNADGTYGLLSDAYCMEAGKRAVIGDDTGLGMVSTMKAEGTYTINEDGSITTSPASHAVFELALDTYSSQMRAPAGYKLGDAEMADGKYDSAEYPAVLDAVPETTWVLDAGTVSAYGKPSGISAGTYTIILSGAEGNVDKVQDYQFQCGNLAGLMNYDTRLTLDLALTLNADGTYELFSDPYCMEAGKRAVIGDDTGLGMVSTMKAEGTYTVNEDGTVTTSPASHAVFELALDTYSSQMRGPAGYKLGDAEMADGKYDSAEYPAVLDAVPETVWTLGSDRTIVSYTSAAVPEAEEPVEEPAPASEPETAAEGVTILSDDGGTEITFNSDGTYRFWFGSYSIEDIGTYTYENGILTLTDKNGKESSGEGDPIKLHYTYSGSDQLTGDYTISADTFSFGGDEVPEAAEEINGVEIISDDGATTITFYPTGTYQFYFSAYDIADSGSYSFVDGILKLTDVNGKESVGEGDPIKLHYTYSGSDQLAGDYTIPAEALAFQAGEELKGIKVISDDHGTSLTLFSDGTYRFWFEPYSIEDLGLWSIADGVLTLTDVNGKESVATGNPYKLHYGYSQSEQLTGDYTISADILPFSVSGCSVPSDDAATTITFFADGSYIFAFGNYNIVDIGSYRIENDTLTVVNANGLEMTMEDGKLHYVSSMSEQLTGDYTLDTAIFN